MNRDIKGRFAKNNESVVLLGIFFTHVIVAAMFFLIGAGLTNYQLVKELASLKAKYSDHYFYLPEDTIVITKSIRGFYFIDNKPKLTIQYVFNRVVENGLKQEGMQITSITRNEECNQPYYRERENGK